MIETTELVLTVGEAEDLTSQICEAVTDAHTLILRALEGRADKTLGYASWQEYVNDRFPISVRQVASSARREMVADLRSEGKSLRAIASVLGVAPNTVRSDLSTVQDCTVPDRVMGLDGKERPAVRSLEPEELAAITSTLEQEFGDGNITVEILDNAVAENLESKRVPAISKPDVGGGISHPARYTNSLMPVFATLVEEGWRILDPFAGTGKIHELGDLITVETVGVEIEKKWAALHEDTQEASALDLPFADASFDAIVTSPTYGNRMADHHNASDPESRRSYTHDLGDELHEENSGDLHWGLEYRTFHRKAWQEATRVASRRFVLNIKDHIRGGKLQLVSMWHMAYLGSLGWQYNVDLSIAHGTPSMRSGENASLRVPWEYVLVFDK